MSSSITVYPQYEHAIVSLLSRFRVLRCIGQSQMASVDFCNQGHHLLILYLYISNSGFVYK